MIGYYFKFLNRLFLSHFLYLTKNRSSNPELYYSASCLFSKQTFRLPQTSKTDSLIILKVYFANLKKIFWDKPELEVIGKERAIIFDSSSQAVKRRAGFLEYFGRKPGYFVSRQSLGGSFNALHAIIHLTFISVLFIFLLPFSFSKYRTNYALLITEIIEWINLKIILSRNSIQRVFHFCIYEKDANFLAYNLMKDGVRVSKITSEVPLAFGNKIVVTNELCLCFAYQKEELAEFEATLFYDNVSMFMPEMLHTYLDVYKGKHFDIPKNVIGFYGSAYWLRKQLNHSMTELISYDTEEELLKMLLRYIAFKRELTLVIFSHPLEKRKEYQLKTARYYANLIPQDISDRVQLSHDDKASVLQFDKVNIGISLLSTIMYERLSLGFKCILAPMERKDFPLMASGLRNICVYSEQQLFDKLDSFLDVEKGVFLRENDLGEYVLENVSYNLI